MATYKANKEAAQALGMRTAAMKVIGRAPKSLVRGKVYNSRGASATSRAWQHGEYR